MRILVTGSSGYIGSKLVAELRQAGHLVIGLDREPPTSSQPDIFVHRDILDSEPLDAAFNQVDLVMHLAAAKADWGISDSEFFRDNLEATQRLLEEGLRCGMLNWFFYSTVGVMGPSSTPIDENAPYAPVIAYGASKAEAEKLFAQAAKDRPKMSVMILRPSAVYGPDNPPDTNIHRLIDSVDKKRFVMVGAGDSYKTTSYIHNLLPATHFLMKKMQPGVSTYIYVDDPVMSTMDLVSEVYNGLSLDGPKVRLPLWFAKSVGSIADVVGSLLKIDFPITSARIKKFNTSTIYDSSSIRKLGYEQPVENSTAVRTTVDWYKQNYS